jgi:enoyl-CoA hydratase/carnithine racemase
MAKKIDLTVKPQNPTMMAVSESPKPDGNVRMTKKSLNMLADLGNNNLKESANRYFKHIESREFKEEVARFYSSIRNSKYIR